jgi:membrane protein YdbS with pleckstrin-like domain
VSLRDELLRTLRVPPAPSAPAGDEGVRVFLAAPNYFRYKLAQWLLSQTGAFVGVIFGLIMLRGADLVIPAEFEIGPWTITEGVALAALGAVEAIAITFLVVQALASLALLRLDFEQRWYLVSDRSLRIREGLLRLHEKTMTFANIQHVAIRQGPIQRLLGIADLEVRTAGGGGGNGEEGAKHNDLHVAYFRGVANAAEIRDGIRERLRRHADAGLGDPDDLAAGTSPREATHALPAAAPPPEAGALAAAAAALREEASALRLALQR